MSFILFKIRFFRRAIWSHLLYRLKLCSTVIVETSLGSFFKLHCLEEHFSFFNQTSTLTCNFVQLWISWLWLPVLQSDISLSLLSLPGATTASPPARSRRCASPTPASCSSRSCSPWTSSLGSSCLATTSDCRAAELCQESKCTKCEVWLVCTNCFPAGKLYFDHVGILKPGECDVNVDASARRARWTWSQ